MRRQQEPDAGVELAQVYYIALLAWIVCTFDASVAGSVSGDELAAATSFMSFEKG
jgi:hypothetical protein